MKTLIYISCFCILFTGCKKKQEQTLSLEGDVISPNVKFTFELIANGAVLNLNDTFVTNQAYPIELNKFRFYIADIHLTNATDSVLLSDIQLVDFEDEFSYGFSISHGTYTGLSLNFGVPDSLNLGDPTTYENESPLGIYGSNGMHWSWLAGYRFLAIDGYAANSTTETTDIGVSLHTGTENLFQQKQINIGNFVVNETENELVIQIPLENIFSANQTDTLDVRTENQSHTFGETAVKVTNRFLNSWVVKP